MQKEKSTYRFKNRMDVEEDMMRELGNAQTKVHRQKQKQSKSKTHGSCQKDDVCMIDIQDIIQGDIKRDNDQEFSNISRR